MEQAELPSGERFDLSDTTPGVYLHHRDDIVDQTTFRLDGQPDYVLDLSFGAGVRRTMDRNAAGNAVTSGRTRPDSLLALRDDLPDRPIAEHKRRIGPWVPWRAGPARGADARYWAARADRLDEPVTLRLFPDGTADGVGPSGTRHQHFRSWKQDLAGSAT